MQPSIIFVATNGELHVFAANGAARPHADTPLFKAPYFNVWEGGHVCAGNVAMPRSLDASAMSTFEQAFYGSRFTHPNDPELVACQGGSIAMWKHLLDNPDSEWEWAKWLVPCDMTLADTIKE